MNRADLLKLAFDNKVEKGQEFIRKEKGDIYYFNGTHFVSKDGNLRLVLCIVKNETWEKIVEPKVTIGFRSPKSIKDRVDVHCAKHGIPKEDFYKKAVLTELNKYKS